MITDSQLCNATLKLVKDVRTQEETSDVESVLNGNIDAFLKAYLMFIKNRNRWAMKTTKTIIFDLEGFDDWNPDYVYKTVFMMRKIGFILSGNLYHGLE